MIVPAGAAAAAAAINLYLSALSLLGAAFIFQCLYSTLRCLLDHGQQTTENRCPIFFFEACKHVADYEDAGGQRLQRLRVPFEQNFP
jgi:hypothetical protein